jgi:sugar lactone lactonase YvrE
VENWQRYAIGKYTIFGDVVNDPLIWLPNAYRGAAVGMAVDSENHLFIADGANGCVREYTTSGAVVNTLLVTGLDWPLGLVLDGQGHFFVASSGAYGTATGTVGEYSTSGMAINATLISGLSNPMGLALDGKGYLFVACSGDGTIKKYTTSGTLVDAALVTGLSGPCGLVCDGDRRLFVCNWYSGTVGAYTTSGVVINATLISGWSNPTALALDGNGHLFVASWGTGSVGEYTTAGDVINASLITIAGKVDGLAVMPVPPPPLLQTAYTSNQFVLSWPLSASNFVLEATSTLSPGTYWVPVTNGVVVDASSFVLTHQTTASSAFYRLHQP